MRIATRLTFISVCIAATMAGLLAALAWSFLAFRSAQASHLLLDRIEFQFLERTSFRDQYFLYREDRMQAMWEQSKAATDSLLDQAGAQFRGPEDQDQLKRLRKSLDESETLFRRIVGNTPKLGAAGGARAVFEEFDKRLSSQLLLKASVVHDELTALREANELKV